MTSNIIYLLTYLCLISSCATIFNSDSQKIHIEASNPNYDPLVKIESNALNFTTRLPSDININSSHSDIKVTMIDDAYEPIIFALNKKIATSFYFNILVPPLGLGFLIDYALGNHYSYDEKLVIPSVLTKEALARKNRDAHINQQDSQEQIEDSEILDLNFDSSSGKGAIKLKGQQIKNRQALLKTIGGICSTANIKVKAGSDHSQGGYYKINKESVKEGAYQIDFHCLY